MAAVKEQLLLTLVDMANRGEALARHEGLVVFAAYGIPGERVAAEIVHQRKHYAVAQVVEVLEPSPHRREPRCPHFGACGGCQWQYIDYPHQLELKRNVVSEQLRRIGKFSDPLVAPTIGTEEPWHYRNHARFSVDFSGQFGFVERHTHIFVPIESCAIMHPRINDIVARLQGKRLATRQVSVRVGVNTRQYLIQPWLEIAEADLDTGQLYYEEELLGHRFRISAASFFQVNIPQAAELAEVVRERLDLTGEELLVDAYAGVGTMGILLATYAGRVVCVEESRAAAEDAAVNIAGISNLAYITGKAEQVLPELAERPDAVILDPPRIGCHQRTLAALIQAQPRKVAYVSCDPATLARDLAILCRGGYTLVEVQPVDMFPQTYHIESVAIVIRE